MLKYQGSFLDICQICKNIFIVRDVNLVLMLLLLMMKSSIVQSLEYKKISIHELDTFENLYWI